MSVDHDGRLDLDQLVEALEPETRLVSIIMANNETGVVQPIAEIAALIRAGSNARFHTDATQAVGKWPVDFRALDVDYLSFSAHKLNGPKGTGCLVARADAPIEPLLLGGSQEKRRRGGTENVAGIVGLGIACELAQGELESRMKSQAHLRDRLWERFRESIPGAQRNAPLDAVLPNTLNVELPGIAGDVLLQALDLEGVSASAGAACHSGSISPSHVLTAMGRSPEAALASLRFSVGLGNTEHEIDRAADLVIELVARMSGSANHG